MPLREELTREGNKGEKKTDFSSSLTLLRMRLPGKKESNEYLDFSQTG